MLTIGVPPERPPSPIPALADHLQMTVRRDLLLLIHAISLTAVFPSVFPTREVSGDLRAPKTP